MEEQRVFSVGIDAIGAGNKRITAEVFDLPGCGCVVAGPNGIDLVDTTLRAVIAEHLAWLRGHGIDAGDPSTVEFEIVEKVETLPPAIDLTSRGPRVTTAATYARWSWS